MPTVTSEIQTDILTNIIGINGEAGTGKTTLATSLVESKDIVYFDAENGSKFIPGVQKFTPTGDPKDNPSKWEDFLQASKEVVLEKKTTLVIDNFYNVCSWCAKYVCDEGEKKELSEFGFGKGEARALAELKRVIDYFIQHNIGLIYICHKKPEYTTIKIKGQAEQSQRNHLNLPSWARTYIVGQSDFIFYIYRDFTGQLKIRTKGDDLTVCKDRPGFLPDEIPNNPVILKKLLFSSKEKFTAQIMSARARMLSGWDSEAENYLKELGYDD